MQQTYSNFCLFFASCLSATLCPLNLQLRCSADVVDVGSAVSVVGVIIIVYFRINRDTCRHLGIIKRSFVHLTTSVKWVSCAYDEQEKRISPIFGLHYTQLINQFIMKNVSGGCCVQRGKTWKCSMEYYNPYNYQSVEFADTLKQL